MSPAARVSDERAAFEPRRVADEVRARVASAGEPEYRAQIERLVPGIRTHGVRVPKLRELAAELARRKPTLDEACELLDELARDTQRDEFLVGVFVLAEQGKALATLEWKRFGRWLTKLDNWETCDQLAMGVAAPCVAAREELDSELLALTSAASPWTRRFTLATAAALNQKGRERVDLTLRICTELATSREPTLLKALAWALREAGDHDRARVRTFLEHNAEHLHRSVQREVAAKLARSR